jgi:hypothetical protein
MTCCLLGEASFPFVNCCFWGKVPQVRRALSCLARSSISLPRLGGALHGEGGCWRLSSVWMYTSTLTAVDSVSKRAARRSLTRQLVFRTTTLFRLVVLRSVLPMTFGPVRGLRHGPITDLSVCGTCFLRCAPPRKRCGVVGPEFRQRFCRARATSIPCRSVALDYW